MSEPQDNLKVIIEQNVHGIYITMLVEECTNARGGTFESHLKWDGFVTLWGARRKGRKWLEAARRERNHEGMKEVIR